VPNPGADEGVITDGMILSGVQFIIALETPAPEGSGPDQGLPPDEPEA